MTTKPRQEPAGSRPPDMSEMDPMETAMMANPMLQALNPTLADDPMLAGQGGPGGPPVEAEGEGEPEGNPAEPSDPRAMKQSTKQTGPLPGVDLLDDSNGKDNIKTDQREHGGANLDHSPPSKVSTLIRMVAYVQAANPQLSDEAAYNMALDALAVMDPMSYGPSRGPAPSKGPISQWMKKNLNPMDPNNTQQWVQAVPGYDPEEHHPAPDDLLRKKIKQTLTPPPHPFAHMPNVNLNPEGTAS